jgi:hypothetical protein
MRMSWRELSTDEWRANSLNRLRGWLIAVLALLVIEGPLSLVMVGSLAMIDPAAMTGLMQEDTPDWLEWSQLAMPVAVTLLLLLAFMRYRRFPEAYVVIRLLGYLVAIASGALAAWALWWFALAQITLIAGEIALVWHLLAGARPNVVFKRRVRIAA